MTDAEHARYVYVSGDGKLQILYELTEQEIEMIVAGTFVIPSHLPDDGTWGVITRNDGLVNMTGMMSEFVKKTRK